MIIPRFNSKGSSHPEEALELTMSGSSPRELVCDSRGVLASRDGRANAMSPENSDPFGVCALVCKIALLSRAALRLVLSGVEIKVALDTTEKEARRRTQSQDTSYLLLIQEEKR